MMSARRGLNRLPTLLALACVALAAIVGIEAYVSPQVPLPSAKLPLAATKDQGELPVLAYDSKPLDSYAEIAERPIFSPSRRPPPPDLGGVKGGGRGGHDDLMLAGVIMAAGKRLAMIEAKKTASVVVVREGQTVDGWSIEAISAEKVVIRQGNQVFDLLLDDALKAPRKPVRRTPRTAPAEAPPSSSPPEARPAPPSASSGAFDRDALPPQEDAGGAAEELPQ